MSLSLDDFEDVKQEEKQSEVAKVAAETASAPSAGIGIKPPTAESSASGLNVPGLINQAWGAVKPAFNPVHYGVGGTEDYTNIDVPTTVAHGLGLSAVGLGVANRIKREISGEAASARQFQRQNDLVERRIARAEANDALAEAQNAENVRQAESKITAQAAGKPVPEARIEPTFAPEPVQAPAVAPPAAAPVAPVEPKPMSELERLRIEKAQFDLEAARAKEARAAEAHAARLAADAKRSELSSQKKTSSGISPQDRQMLESSERAKFDKAIAADQKAIAATKAPAPAAPVTTAPVAEAAAVPKAAVPPSPSLTKEQKGMKNYLVSQYGGGPEGEAAYKKVIDILGEVPAYEKGQGGGLSKEANEAIKTWRKTHIEGPKVNLTHDMKKAMKGAGGIAILAAIPGFAEAAQRKDYGAMSDIASDFLVLPFAQSREAGMPRAKEESIIESKFKEAQKLGSPYRSVPPPTR